jgi:hypothetical protein
VSLIYREQTPDASLGNYVMRTFESPSFLRADANIWDVCFFSYPYIIESNLFLQSEPSKADHFFSYYTKLQVFLKNRKEGVKFSEVLGFDSEGVYRINDTWLDPGVFENALANELIG